MIHPLSPFIRATREGDCIRWPRLRLLLEFPPTLRTVLASRPDGVRSHRIALPYLVFPVTISRYERKCAYLQEIRVFARDAPLTGSPDDLVYALNLPNVDAFGITCMTYPDPRPLDQSLDLAQDAVETFWASAFLDDPDSDRLESWAMRTSQDPGFAYRYRIAWQHPRRPPQRIGSLLYQFFEDNS